MPSSTIVSRWPESSPSLTAVAFLPTVDKHIEARMQVALADRLLISKADIADTDDVTAVQQALTSINPHARQSVIHPQTVTMDMFWPNSLDLPRSLMKPLRLMCSAEPAPLATASLAFDGAIAPDVLEAWLDHTIGLLGSMLLRMKAMLDIDGAPGPTVLHVVQGLLHQPTDLEEWPVLEQRNRIVLIGRDVEEQNSRRCPGATTSDGQANSEDTERSSLIRSIASPISGATEMWRSFGRCRFVSSMLSVTVNDVRRDASILSSAAPDSTP